MERMSSFVGAVVRSHVTITVAAGLFCPIVLFMLSIQGMKDGPGLIDKMFAAAGMPVSIVAAACPIISAVLAIYVRGDTWVAPLLLYVIIGLVTSLATFSGLPDES